MERFGSPSERVVKVEFFRYAGLCKIDVTQVASHWQNVRLQLVEDLKAFSDVTMALQSEERRLKRVRAKNLLNLQVIGDFRCQMVEDVMASVGDISKDPRKDSMERMELKIDELLEVNDRIDEVFHQTVFVLPRLNKKIEDMKTALRLEHGWFFTTTDRNYSRDLLPRSRRALAVCVKIRPSEKWVCFGLLTFKLICYWTECFVFYKF